MLLNKLAVSITCCNSVEGLEGIAHIRSVLQQTGQGNLCVRQIKIMLRITIRVQATCCSHSDLMLSIRATCALLRHSGVAATCIGIG
ncbi:hypothetical protein D3C81_1977420 [compost metagenome]